MTQNSTDKFGGVLAEAAVGMFLLTMMLVFVIGLIQFASAYHTMSQALRVCTHVNMYRDEPTPLSYSQTQSDYNSFAFPSQSDFEDCVDNPAVATDCIHKVVHWKIRQHLISNQPRISNVTIASTWDNAGIEQLVVTLEGQYSSGLFFVDHPMNVASVADPCIAPPSPSASIPSGTSAPPSVSASPPATSASPPATSAAPPATSAAPPATSGIPPPSVFPPATTAVPPGTSPPSLPTGTVAPATSALPPSASPSAGSSPPVAGFCECETDGICCGSLAACTAGGCTDPKAAGLCCYSSLKAGLSGFCVRCAPAG